MARNLYGEFVVDQVPFAPDADLITQIQAWNTAGTTFETEFFAKFSTTENWKLSKCTTNDIPEVRIQIVAPDNSLTFVVVGLVNGYIDYESNYKPYTAIRRFKYASGAAPSLTQQVAMTGTDMQTVKGVTSGGMGRVIAVDTSNLYVYVVL